MSSNLSELFSENIQQLSGGKLPEDKNYDAEHVYKKFRTEMRQSHHSTLLSSDEDEDDSSAKSHPNANNLSESKRSNS